MDEKPDSDQISPQNRSDEPDLDRLRRLVIRLRSPGGCPWDQEQTLASVRAYLIEEAHEAAAALDNAVAEQEWSDLEEELGDLLFQASFVAVLAEEEQRFTLASAIERVEAKMIERHPHVFGDDSVAGADEVRQRWEQRKRRPSGSILDGVPPSLPALTAAYRMTQKAASLGFDRPDSTGVLAKIDEELGELREALEGRPVDRDRLEDEIGDLLFTAANLARHVGLDPEAALARTNQKFRRRFSWVERGIPMEGETPDLERLEALWQEAKDQED
jgi:ATP diphosphatase